MNRPRDRYGRPLPHDADPGVVVSGVPERAFITGEQAWREAQAYLADDLPFHAHEVFEQRWRCSPETERACWKALAQWGAALTHRARENPVGAKRVADRALRGLHSAPVVPSFIDTAHVRDSCTALLGD